MYKSLHTCSLIADSNPVHARCRRQPPPRPRPPPRRACGTFEFSAGGDEVPKTWTGPTLTLTQTTASCALVYDVEGVGNPSWTGASQRLACLGPATQYIFTPITYAGHSVEAESFACPECKVVRQFGRETSITLWGGSKEKIKFRNEAEFYAAMLTNGTFDLWASQLKDAVLGLQEKLTALANVGGGAGEAGGDDASGSGGVSSGSLDPGALGEVLTVDLGPGLRQQVEQVLGCVRRCLKEPC